MAEVISKYCSLKDKILTLNGKIIGEQMPNENLVDVLTRIYHKKKIDYPKFFKMDILCKLAFILSEFILIDETDDNTQTSIVFANHSSSIVSDITHEESIKDKGAYYPSPAVFVYTLPNIMIGEVSIRHNISGENVFFASDKIDFEQLHLYSSCLLKEDSSKKCLVGWINVEQNNEEGFMVLIEVGTKKNLIPYGIDNLYRLYNQELVLDTA